jgi:hypothetical protein
MDHDRRHLLLGAGIVGLGLAAEAAAQPSNDASRSAQRLSAAASYIPLPRTTATVMIRGRPSGVLLCEVGLDVPDAVLRARVTGLAPRIRDALGQTLATYVGVHMRPNSAPDPDHISRLMQAAVDQVGGQAGARVLITDLMLQSPNF